MLHRDSRLECIYTEGQDDIQVQGIIDIISTRLAYAHNQVARPSKSPFIYDSIEIECLSKAVLVS